MILYATGSKSVPTVDVIRDSASIVVAFVLWLYNTSLLMF